MTKKIKKQDEEKITETKLLFLKNFPLDEIDNDDIRLICRSYRNDNSTLLSGLTYLNKYDEYFSNWLFNNKACNLFYGGLKRT